MRKQYNTPWICSMKNEIWLQLSRLSTNKIYDVTIVVASKVGLSKKVIWCSDSYRKAEKRWNAQVILSMGRTVCGQQEPVQRILLPSGYTRESGHAHKHGGDSQAVEHRTTPFILHLSRNRNITVRFTK